MFFLQAGFSFIEVIIALSLFSMGFLGFGCFNALSLQTHYVAYQESQAISQILSMIQRLQANYPRWSTELYDWNEQNHQLLPHGRGEVRCNGKQCHIQLKWRYQGPKILQTTIAFHL